MLNGETPFHERFEDSKDSKTRAVKKILSAAIPSVVSSTAKYYKEGPTLEQWNLAYYVTASTVKRSMKNLASDEYPNISGAQKISSIPGYLPMNAKVKEDPITTNEKVINFIKDRAPGEWPAPAEQVSEIYGEWVTVSKSNPNKVVYLLHGGAYVMGSALMYRPFAYIYAKKAESSVYALNYRLAPQNPYPCAVIDAVSGYLHLLEKFDPKNIVLIGDSAGGGLVISTLLVLRDMGIELPAGGVCLSPWLDLTHSCPSFQENAKYDILPTPPPDPRLESRVHYYAPDEHLKLPYVSPFWEENLDNLPPLLIHAGSAEQLLDEIIDFSGRLAKSNSSVTLEVFEAHLHVFQGIMRFSKGAKVAYGRIGNWIKKAMDAKGILDEKERNDLDFDGKFWAHDIMFFLCTDIGAQNTAECMLDFFTMTTPFHKRFDENPKKILFILKIIFRLVPDTLQTIFRFLFFGPPVKSWTLSYYLGVRFIRTIFTEIMRGDKPKIVEGQWISSALPNIIPGDGVQIGEIYQTNQKAIEFIKSNSPGEWVPQTESIVDISGDWIHPKTVESTQVVYYLHGGGFFLGSSNMYRRMAYMLSKYCCCKTFVPNYRLAPQNPYPIPIIDLVSGYLWLIQKVDPSKITIIGDSAGGNLVAAILLVLRDMGIQLPAGAVLLSPNVDVTHDFASWDANAKTDYIPEFRIDSRGDKRQRYYVPNELQKEPYASPIWADLTGLPPMLIQAGSRERLVDSIVSFVEKMERSANSHVTFEMYHDHVHVHTFFDYHEGAKIAFKRSVFVFLFYGPPVKSWTLSYYIGVRFFKTIFGEIMKGNTPNIIEGQRVTSMPNILPGDALQVKETFTTNSKVIEFMKRNAPGEWVPHSESVVNVSGDWIHPKSIDSKKILYFIHGGGHFLGSSNMYRRTAYQVAKSCNSKSFVVNYRLAPQNPYPIPIIDLVSGYMTLIEKGDPSNIVFIGDSAGGNLVASTLLMDLTHEFPSWNENTETDFLPDLPIDSRGEGRLRYYALNYLLKEPYVSPCFAKDLTRLPPLLIQAGGGERLVDCIIAFVARISANSNSSVTFEVYSDHVHVFQFLDYCPAAMIAIERYSSLI
ncbi:hypothetical protein HDV06_006069 [Boothiomyces sp. JEL0866]|nr:hypothetical protein HDV06_006069 [Boothiomyces sp. JEL0866]